MPGLQAGHLYFENLILEESIPLAFFAYLTNVADVYCTRIHELRHGHHFKHRKVSVKIAAPAVERQRRQLQCCHKELKLNRKRR